MRYLFHYLFYLSKVCYKIHIRDTARGLSGTDTVQQTFCLPETFIIQFGDIRKCYLSDCPLNGFFNNSDDAQ